MKLALWKRTTLGTLMALTLAGGLLTALTTGQASADIRRDTCHGANLDCGVPRSEN